MIQTALLQRTLCALCGEPATHHVIEVGEQVFCCEGCKAVYQILESKGELGDFSTSQIFIEALQSGLISNPSLLTKVSKSRVEDQKKEYFEIEHMWCPSCTDVIRMTLLQKEGLIDCFVDYATDLATVTFDLRKIDKEEIFKAISAYGYRPRSLEEDRDRMQSLKSDKGLMVAFFCSLNVMMASYPVYASYFFPEKEGLSQIFIGVALLFSLPVFFYSALPIFRRFWIRLKLGVFGMETLVAISTFSAFTLSIANIIRGVPHVFFDSMCVIILFVLTGKQLEARAKFHAKTTIYRLSRSLPKKGRKIEESGQANSVLLKDVLEGERLLICQGEQIPLDGLVLEGEGYVDESLLTGESFPKKIGKGDALAAGSILSSGQLILKVEKAFQRSTLMKMVDMLEMDIRRKKSSESFVDKISAYFVPFILFLAFFSTLVKTAIGIPPFEAFLAALSVLLISCPCAIGIAVPLSEALVRSRFAALGGILRNRDILKIMGKEEVVLFDKTGTLTEGRFEVLSSLNLLTENETIILRSMTCRSRHPISQAIFSYLEKGDVVDGELKEINGRGMEFVVEGALYRLGSPAWLGHQEKGKETEVFFEKDGELLCSICLGDQLRKGALELVAYFKKNAPVLISGDSKKAVAALAKQLGLRHFFAEMLPMDKRVYVEQKQKEGKSVAMFGDGINDSLSLSKCDLAVSLTSGSDLAVQISDLLLTQGDLSIYPRLAALAKKGRRIAAQNLFWAFFYNLIGIGLALYGILSPVFSAFAMVTSSLIVLFNSLRLKPKALGFKNLD